MLAVDKFVGLSIIEIRLATFCGSSTETTYTSSPPYVDTSIEALKSDDVLVNDLEFTSAYQTEFSN